MKNAIFFLFLLSFIFSSCTTTDPIGPGVNKKIEVTTSTKTKTALTEPRFDCNGLRLKHDKVVDWLDETLKRDTVVTCVVSDQELKNEGYVYTGENPAHLSPKSGSSWDWGSFRELLIWVAGIILAILMLWLLLWLLKEFVLWLTRPRSPQPQPIQPAQPAGTFVPEGYNLVPKGYTLVPEGSALAPKGTSIVSDDKVLIPKEGIYSGIRREKEAFHGAITPANETSETHNFYFPANAGWPEREEKENTPKEE